MILRGPEKKSCGKKSCDFFPRKKSHVEKKSCGKKVMWKESHEEKSHVEKKSCGKKVMWKKSHAERKSCL